MEEEESPERNGNATCWKIKKLTEETGRYRPRTLRMQRK